MRVTGSEIGRVASGTRRGEYVMAKAARKITLPPRDIPFDKLVLSQSNVRRVRQVSRSRNWPRVSRSSRVSKWRLAMGSLTWTQRAEVFRDFGGNTELLHLAESVTAVGLWIANEGYRNARLEIGGSENSDRAGATDLARMGQADRERQQHARRRAR